MAKILEEVLEIKISRLVKDDDKSGTLFTTDFLTTIVTVAEELIGEKGVVELEVK